MRVLLALFAGVVVLVTGARAGRADDEPRATAVHGKLAGITATFTVRYRVAVEGGVVARSSLAIAIPSRAVVTRASATAGGGRHPLALVEAANAATAFDAIGGRPTGPQGRWAMLVEGSVAGNVEISIAAPRTTTLELELAIEMPTCFFRDARYAAVPNTWFGALDPPLRALPAKLADLEAACGNPGDELWVTFPSRALAGKPTLERVGAVAGRIAVGATDFARVELDVAATLAEIPRDLATAIVVDGSRSLSLDELAVERAAIAGYLRAAPQSQVQVIAYARRATALLPGWTAAARAAPALAPSLAALGTRNGSNLDAGLAEAGRWLARIAGTRRVVLLTDDRLARRLETLDPGVLQALVPPGTVIHVVVVSAGDELPVRDDTALLAPLATATAGMAIRTGIPEGGLDATLLVRPLTVDRIRLKTPGWHEILRTEAPCGESLEAGHTCTWWGEGSAISGPIVVEAMIWGQRIVRVLHPDLGQATTLARELAGFATLDEPTRTRVELAARAVNPRWSLFAEWGGPDGYETSHMIGSCCHSRSTSGGSHDFGFGVPGPPRGPPRFDLRGQLAAAVAGCKLGSATAEADVETTLDEIVAVAVAVHGEPSLDDQHRLVACVEDAIWSVEVSVPAMLPHVTTHVAFAN